MIKYRRFKKILRRRWPFFILLILALIVIGLLAYRHSSKKTPSVQNQATITKDNSGSPAKTNGPTSNYPPGQGGVIDQNGQTITSQPPASQYTTSKSGLLTVKQPASGATLKSGDNLSGTAQVSTIQFRLIDNVVGVIAQGSLNVVNSNFSGILKFQTNGSSGRLDVFSTDPSSGAEINEVQIPVSF